MPRSRERGGTRMPRSGDDTSRPAMLISPAVGCSSPATQRSVVVLPQPDGPSSTTISPAGTAKLTPSIGRPADRKLLAQVGDVERRRHDVNACVNVTITADVRRSCPIPPPMARAA